MTEVDSRFDDIDVETILARVEKREPFSFSRRRCIYQAPEFTQRLPAHETVEEGSTVTFGCKVLGFPKPSVTWFKDDDVIGPESRAELTTEENGVYSMKLQDVSKCDSGAYKVSATNLEGSSTSSLCITVKGKSKSRNRKKKKTRAVACTPLFPVIVEHTAEERRETEATEQQDDSPLTPLYSGINRKSPVTWPAFLGEWAYQSEEGGTQELEDLEIECEDVFDTDSDRPSQACLTFVSSAYEQHVPNQNNGESDHAPNDQHTKHEHCKSGNDEAESSVHAKNKTNEEHSREVTLANAPNGDIREITGAGIAKGNENTRVKQSNDNKPPSTLSLASSVIEDKTSLKNNANGDLIKNNSGFENSTSQNENNINKPTNNSVGAFTIPPKELEEEIIHFDPSEVAQISVNRSYAKGNSTFSVATRSSPFRTSRSRSGSPCNRDRYGRDYSEMPNDVSANGNAFSGRPDTSTLQNMNNERLLQRMRQSEQFGWYPCLVKALTWTGTSEDNLLEMMLLICGSTFLALLFDLSPATFVFDIVVGLIVKLVVHYVFQRL